jgi:hypothetical protein
MTRIAAREKFLWRGWEFRQSLATATEVHWEMRLPKLRVRLIYRDIQDSRCWCGHELTEHGLSRCVEGCKCAGREPRPGGRGFEPETPPEYTAIIHFQGLEEGKGRHEGGNGVDATPDRALSNAEEDFLRKCAHAVRIATELRRGKPEDP